MQNTSTKEEELFVRDPSKFTPPSPLHIPDDITPESVSDEAFAAVADELINDVIFEICFREHKASKLGHYSSEVFDEATEHRIVGNKEKTDIYGQVTTRHNIECPHCARKLEASRFANHLEKCYVGNGRQSSRNATRKIDAMESDYDDDENGSDSSYSSRKKPKKKANKGFRKRVHKDPSMQFNIEASSSSVGSGLPTTDSSLKQFFDQYCGVKSRRTKKLCGNKIKCQLHTDIMREIVRKEILNSHVAETKVEDVQIDVDTVEEASGFYSTPGVSRGSSPEFSE